MDYKTFNEAHAHNRRDHRHVINLIHTHVDQGPTFCVFLGAGASISSGVPPASAMVAEWRRRLYAAAREDHHLPFETWLGEQEWYQADDEYSRLFEAVYDQPSQRRVYIESKLQDAAPSWGYAYLASLIEQEVFNAIFTTNFDDLANEACFAFTANTKPLVCAHDSAVRSIRMTSQRPKIIKLHGDFLYDSIKNTSSELQSLEANMREKFTEFAREYGLIVMGYSGSDRSVMDLLDVLVRSDQYFRNGIYWCVRRGDVPGRRVRQLLRNDRVYWVEIDGFDPFLAEIANVLDIGVPAGIKAPHQVGIHRVRHLAIPPEKTPSLPSRIKHDRSRLEETLTRISQILDLRDVMDSLGTRMPNTAKRSRNYARELGEASVYWQIDAAMDEKRFQEAADLAKPLVASHAHDHEYTRIYLRALMRCPDRRQDAVEFLKGEIPTASRTSEAYSERAEFAIMLNESALALQLAEQGLSMNPHDEPLLLYKACALLQQGRAAEAKPMLEEFFSLAADDYWRASAATMLGRIDEAIVLLQRSIIRENLDASYVLENVLFRLLWQDERALQALRALDNSVRGDETLCSSCPCHPSERALHSLVHATLPAVESEAT